MGAPTPMIAQADPSSLVPLLAGPASAVIVLMVVLYGLYLLAVKHFIPLAAKLGERHLAQIDAMIVNQREEGKAFAKALASIDKRLARLEGGTDVGGLTLTQIHPNPGALSPDRGA